MFRSLSTHWEIFTAILGQRWLKWIGGAWFLLGTWDLVLSQFVPEDLAKKFPKAYEVIAMTYGWLPWWAWGWIGTAIFMVAVFEYAVRLHSRAAVGWVAKKSGPQDNKRDAFTILFGDGPPYKSDDGSNTFWRFSLKNSGPDMLDNVKVKLIAISGHTTEQRLDLPINILPRSLGDDLRMNQDEEVVYHIMRTCRHYNSLTQKNDLWVANNFGAGDNMFVFADDKIEMRFRAEAADTKPLNFTFVAHVENDQVRVIQKTG